MFQTFLFAHMYIISTENNYAKIKTRYVCPRLPPHPTCALSDNYGKMLVQEAIVPKDFWLGSGPSPPIGYCIILIQAVLVRHGS